MNIIYYSLPGRISVRNKMVISEVIKKLRELKKEFGDIDVCYTDEGGDYIIEEENFIVASVDNVPNYICIQEALEE